MRESFSVCRWEFREANNRCAEIEAAETKSKALSQSVTGDIPALTSLSRENVKRTSAARPINGEITSI